MGLSAATLARETALESGKRISAWQLGRISPMPSRVPSGWRLVHLTSIARLESGHTPSRRRPEYWDGGIPWISLHDSAALDVPEIHATAYTISPLGLEHSSARLLPTGTVVFSRTATVGKSTVMGREMATSQDFANYVCGDELHNRYLVHLFRFMTPEWNRLMAGSTHNSVYMPVFHDLQILLPPLNEQMAVAETLGDVDAFIDSVDRLLTKKQRLKQGAMRELLAAERPPPRVRSERGSSSTHAPLPRGWRSTTLGAIAEVKTGPFGSSLHERDYVDDGTPIITVEHLGPRGIVHTDLPMVSDDDFRRLSGYALDEGDIVFSRVGSVDRNALVTAAERGWLFSGRLLRVRTSSSEVNSGFLSYQFHSEPFKRRVRTVAVGQTMPSLNTQLLASVVVDLPPVDEQTYITSVLRDMDEDIAALEVQLAKARDVKRAMAQELLTGRIRLA
jgi:type I restriction enzyme S subunit